MKLSFLTFILISVSLVGCTSPKESTHERVIERRVEVPFPEPPEGRPQGPSDGGGGAGVAGKPLESYRINVRDRNEFIKNIGPILKNLTKSFPRLAADLVHVVDSRTWYLIPGPLKKLPGAAMGLESFVDFDQLAFQNLNDIWIDSKPYKTSMDEMDQARLILHEMVVGVRLLEFADALDICLAEAKILNLREETSEEYRIARRKCFNSYPRLGSSQPKLEIPEREYSSIRALVVELFENQGKVDPEEVKDWLSSNGFKTYKSN